jgi:large subunit ribosomal protein LP2
MRYIAAYLLLQIGGNSSPSKKDIKKLLSTVGVDSDDDRLDKLLSELEGKSIDQLIAEGSSKLSSVPSGGGGGGVAAASGGGGGGGGGAAAAEAEPEKKEEAKVSTLISVLILITNYFYRKSPTTIWALVCSTKGGFLHSVSFIIHPHFHFQSIYNCWNIFRHTQCET